MYKIDHGSYPYHGDFVSNTAAAATWAKTNLPGVNDSVLLAPGAPSSTVNSWTSAGGAVTSSTYTYYARKDASKICTAMDACPYSYVLAWRDEGGTMHRQIVTGQ